MAFVGRLLQKLAGTMPLFPWAWVTFLQIPYFASRCYCVFCFVRISTSLSQEELSLISGINTFNLKNSCVLSLVLETSFIAIWNGFATTAVSSRPLESASKVNSKNFPHLHRYQHGGKGLFFSDLRSQTKNGELICKAENGKVHCFCLYPSLRLICTHSWVYIYIQLETIMDNALTLAKHWNGAFIFLFQTRKANQLE